MAKYKIDIKLPTAGTTAEGLGFELNCGDSPDACGRALRLCFAHLGFLEILVIASAVTQAELDRRVQLVGFEVFDPRAIFAMEHLVLRDQAERLD